MRSGIGGNQVVEYPALVPFGIVDGEVQLDHRYAWRLGVWSRNGLSGILDLELVFALRPWLEARFVFSFNFVPWFRCVGKRAHAAIPLVSVAINLAACSLVSSSSVSALAFFKAFSLSSSPSRRSFRIRSISFDLFRCRKFDKGRILGDDVPAVTFGKFIE